MSNTPSKAAAAVATPLRRRAALGALGSISALSLLACGGGGGGGGTAATSTSTTSTTLLGGLSLSEGALSPEFTPATTSYTASVANATGAIAFSPTLADSGATVAINGTAVASGVSSGGFALNVGDNSFNIVASKGGVSTSHTVIVKRAPPTLSADASLKALSISTGSLSPAFAAATTSYAVTVANSVTSVTLAPTANGSGASIKVNDATVASGGASGALALNVGNNTLTVTVLAQDGVTSRVYTVTVVRAVATATASGDATLSALALSSGTLSPAFASGTVAYTASVANSVASVTLTPTATSADATITVNGSAVKSGGGSAGLALSVGSNVLSVVVSAQDGTHIITYTVAVTRAAAVSTDASLSALAISSGTLAPTFATATLGYTASVANSVSSVTLKPTSSASATIKVNGVATASGATSAALALSVGSNTLSVVVTAQDGSTTRTYTVIVTRAAATLSSDAALSGLTLSSGTLSPVFSASTTSYTASVINSVATVTLSPVAGNSGATIKVNSATVASGATSASLALNVGSNTLTVAVTAQDGATSKTYTVVVTRAAAVACSVIPEETAGPYPADGSNASSQTYNVLALSGIVRSDIRGTLGSSTQVGGVPLTINITLQNVNNNCAPLAGYAIYLWHCTREGAYSVYTESSVNANYLRGVQPTDANGVATFTTIFPGCYAGRMPHMHFEVYPSVAKATTASNKIKTSQLAFPTDICTAVYAAASGYTASVRNFSSISFATDNVFSDGYSLEMTSLSGSVATGYVANVTVSIAV
ncbi:cadherin-like beta sandwich domain-containing protein [Pseudoduganella namucuonensis]|uniref:Cadherin-like beta sandwich domain-containing protein n=1 Tax=Pseudoduganella namucuonensis TaxID=1035707 RepID=A0A1I7KJR1_9BURK|nr:cadherin-like beta sandwich domain-containing protein [Pseudoduganella namucuonensis]SFU97677.1 Cadherin-like beta sandwich domain-containing protein [Pseudoduganella namucuonensis]